MNRIFGRQQAPQPVAKRLSFIEMITSYVRGFATSESPTQRHSTASLSTEQWHADQAA